MTNFPVRNAKLRIMFLALAMLGVLLLSSSLVASNAQSNVGAAASANWLAGGNYPYNWNYNSQDVINASNVKNLQISWVYPMPGSPAPYQNDEGVIEPVEIYQGIAYFITNWQRVYALSAANGQVIWYKDLPLNFSSSEIMTEGNGHYHQIWFSTHILNQPLVWICSNSFQIFALNALTGDIEIEFQPVNITNSAPGAIPGNYGGYAALGNSILIDDQRGIVMFGAGDTEGTTAGRGFWEAWNVSTGNPTLMWRDFIMPPQNGSDPNWDLSDVANMTNAYIFNGTGAVDLKTLSPSVLNATLYDDWGNLGFNGTNSFGGTNTAWGGTMALDPVNGVAYVATAQAAPDWNATFRPGPDLWSDSILSINDTTGAINWAFQTSAHDTWDWDCSWSVILGNATINGQNTPTIFKSCKNGYFYALNANTGALEWYFDAPTIARVPDSQLHNPLNRTQMTIETECYNTCTTVVQNPTDTGAIESDPAYNPVTGMVFTATYNAPTNFSLTDVGPTPGAAYDADGANLAAANLVGTENTTIYGLNASTGAVVWNYTLPSDIGFRGGISDSGGVLYVPAVDGNLYMLNDQTGQLISKLLVGEMNVEPAIGQDANGNWKIIIPSSSSGAVGGTPIPGNIFALALPNSTSAASSVSTSPPTTVVTTVTTGGATSVQTVTTQVSVSASSSGVSSGAFYGVVVVAIILLITTAFFAMRRRPAASSSSSTTSSTTTT
jgi:outer membrane protein assembly factor BamB